MGLQLGAMFHVQSGRVCLLLLFVVRPGLGKRLVFQGFLRDFELIARL